MSRTTEKFWHYNYRVGLLGLMVLIFLLGCAPRATTKPDIEKNTSVRNIIHNIDVRENDSDVSVVISASQPLPYVALPNPLGMDIIFENTAFESFKEDVPVENELIKSIRCDLREEARSARIKLNLGAPAKHEVLREGNDLIIKYEKPAVLYSAREEIGEIEEIEDTEAVSTAQKETKTEQVLDTATTTKKPAWVNRVDFETQKEGKSRVIIETSGKVPYEIKRFDKKVVLVLSNTKMLQYQERPLITTRFKSAVDRISPVRMRDKKDTVLITVELREMVPYRVEQKENIYVLHFDPSMVPPRPLSAARLPAWEEILQESATALVKKEPEKKVAPKEEAVVTETGKKYTGRKISLEFQDANIHNVFRILAEVSGQNFVIGEDVKGQVTLKLINVPWDQVMNLVLQMNKLGMVFEGNIIRIAQMETLKKEKDAWAAKIESEKKADPLFTEYIAIKYAKAADIKGRLDEIKSDRGTVTLDERTNMIIMRDIQKALNEATEIVKILDIPTPQVLIEARIVEASTSFSRELGIQWGGSWSDTDPARPMSVAGAAGGADYLVNLPPGGGWTSGVGFGFSRVSGLTTLTLNAKLLAMESQGRGKIISTPKITTLDNVTAMIQQGDKVPYPKQSEDGISVEYAAATLKLEVTPHISPDKKVSLVINVKKEAADWQHTVLGAPTITTKEAQTELLVANGETVAIGGIIIGERSWAEQGVPWLSKIPILGWFFKSKLRSDSKTELLIFITPKIIELDDKGHGTNAGNDIVS